MDVVTSVCKVTASGNAYGRRSWELMQHARKEKSLKAERCKTLVCCDEAQTKISKFNRSTAVRKGDLIELNRKQQRVKGKGQWRTWTSGAVLRACFGHSCEDGNKHRINVLASSSSALASQTSSGPTHVQNLRDGTAMLAMKRQQRMLDELVQEGAPDLVVITASFDETTQEVSVEKQSTGKSILMSSAKLVAIHGEKKVTIDVVLPVAVLRDGTAETLLTVLKHRLPLLVWFDGACPLIVTLNSDSHKACVRLGKHFSRLAEDHINRFHLHSRCQQHMINAALVHATETLQLINGSFCATVQLHSGTVLTDMKHRCKEMINERLRCVFVQDPSWPESRACNRSFVDLFLCRHGTENKNESKLRREAAENLLQWCPEVWCLNPGRVTHYCPPGCCASRDDAVCKISGAFEDLVFSVRPKVPAVSRWTKLFQPWSWWVMGFTCFALLPAAFLQTEPHEDLTEQLCMSMATLFGAGHDSSDVWKAKERTRWRKAGAWIKAPHTACHALLVIMLMRPVLDTMGIIFDGDKSRLSAVHFAAHETSPSVKAIQELATALQDTRSAFWKPFATATKWSKDAKALAGTIGLRLMGHLYLRSVLPFKFYPWRLAKVVNPVVPERERDVVLQEFVEMDQTSCECCLDQGFSAKIWRMMQAAGTDSHQVLQVLWEGFQSAPLSNVPVENRFARSRNHAVPARGRCPRHTTIASKHVLSELRHNHVDHVRRHLPLQTSNAKSVRKNGLKRAACGWNMFVQKYAGVRISAGTLSHMWHDLERQEQFDQMSKQHNDKNKSADNAEDENQDEMMDLPFGDKAYPLRPDELAHSPELVRLAKQEWPNAVGSIFGPDEDIQEPSDNSKLCQFHYGPGRCVRTLTPEQKMNIDEINEQLKRMALDKYPSDSMGGMHEGTPKLLLYLVCFKEPHIDPDRIMTVILLQLARSHNPLVSIFVGGPMINDDDLQPGDRAHFSASMETFHDNTDMAFLLRGAKEIRYYRVDWEQTDDVDDLMDITIKGWVDVTDILPTLKRPHKPRETNQLRISLTTFTPHLTPH